MNKLFLFFTILHISSQAKISYYIDRQTTLNGRDYLHLFLHENPNHKGQKLVYEIPHRFRNKEVFKLKICNKGTKKKLRDIEDTSNLKVTNDILEKNCLHDTFNTRSMIDYEQRILLEQIPVYNLYKLCNFGFAYFEAEKSFLFTSRYTLITKKLISHNEEKLYYVDTTAVGKIFNEGYKKNFREKGYNTNVNNRCINEFKQKNGDFTEFEISKFIQKIMFFDDDENKSTLIIEYDFGIDFLGEKPVIRDFHDTEVVDNKTKTQYRDDIINDMKKDFVFKKIEFKQSNLKMSISETSMDLEAIKNKSLTVKDSLKSDKKNLLINVDINGTTLLQSKFNIGLAKNTFIRFFPMLCYNQINKKAKVSYDFFGNYSCMPLSRNKILLSRNQKNQLYFLQEENNMIYSYRKIELGATEMNLDFYSKEDSSKHYSIEGFEEKCDGIYDGKLSLFYFICYQKVNEYTGLFKAFKETRNKSYLFMIQENSQLYFKNLKKHHFELRNQIGLIAGSVALFISFIAFVFFASMVFGWLFLIIGVILVILAIFIRIPTSFWMVFSKDSIDEMKKQVLKTIFYYPNRFDDEEKMTLIRPAYLAVKANTDAKIVSIANIDLAVISDLQKNIILDEQSSKIERSIVDISKIKVKLNSITDSKSASLVENERVELIQKEGIVSDIKFEFGDDFSTVDDLDFDETMNFDDLYSEEVTSRDVKILI